MQIPVCFFFLLFFFFLNKEMRMLSGKNASVPTTVIRGVMDLKVHFKVTVRTLTLSFTEKNC